VPCTPFSACPHHAKENIKQKIIIKNVKKPNGSKPGMVIYDNYNTVNVRPELPDNDDIN
jgi:hypothetical protein